MDWLIIIAGIIASVISVTIINRGITNSCWDDILWGLVLLFINLSCLVINIHRKVK